jgi:hypothetical protein
MSTDIVSAMSRALVLNASYEPLSVVPSRRAAVLVLLHKADVLHGTGEALHSEHLEVPVPSVSASPTMRPPQTFPRRASL